MIRRSYSEQLETEHREQRLSHGEAEPHLTDREAEHDEQVAARDRLTDLDGIAEQPAPLERRSHRAAPACTCGTGHGHRFLYHPGHRYHCPRYNRRPTNEA